MSFEFPSFKLWTESQGSQTIQLTVSFSKRAWSVNVYIYNEIFIFCGYYVLLVIMFIYLQHISTVHISMFIVKLYLSICMICSYELLHIVLVFEFKYILFYKHGVFFGQPQYVIFFSLKSCQWYAESMILLYDTNNDVEENGGNVSLRVLVFVGIKNFSVDLYSL